MAELGKLRASDLLKSVTLTVKITGLRSFRVRVWLGVQLLKLAARIIGVGKIEIEESHDG